MKASNIKLFKISYSAFLLLFLVFFISSCETNKLISVRVVDKVTKQPIDSVLVEIKAGRNGDYTKNGAKGYTNADGRFETHMMIGCAFGCYDIYLEYDKNGYLHKTEFNKTEGTVELEK